MAQRIVVLGGGFAGVSTAQELAKRLRKQGRLAAPEFGRGSSGMPGGDGTAPTTPSPSPPDDGLVSVTLLDRANYFVFQPLLADVISGTIETTHVVVPLRRMLKHVDVEVGYVEDIDTRAREVHVRRRHSGETFTVPYDALVVALGSVTDFRRVPGMAEYALGVRTLGDAFYLRNRALAMLEEAATESDPERRRRLLTFVVVGGGSTGVEVAAELEDLVRTAWRTFPRSADATRPADADGAQPADAAASPEPEVVLVHSGPYVLPDFGDRLGRYATKKLRQAGVRLVLEHRLVSVDADGVDLDDGTRIDASTVVSTVGNAPHPVVSRLPAEHDERGWLRVDATFAVPGLEAVWALGDCASIPDPRTGRPQPATAQHAIREGPVAARNVLAVLDGGQATAFDYGQQGMLVSLGRFRGVGEVKGLKVSGFLAWFLWRSYYLLRLPSLERRLRVAIDWTLDLMVAHDVTEISMRRTRSRPGEEVGERRGEPVSAGARPDAYEELVV